MEIALNPDGTRNRDFRPYISQEELHRNFSLYNPNGRSHDHGLYRTAQPYCNTWHGHISSQQQLNHRAPASVVDRMGYTHLIGGAPARVSCDNGRSYKSLMRYDRRYR